MSALIRWNPGGGGMAVRPLFRPFRLLEEVEEMARNAFETGPAFKVDLYEEEAEVVVKAELPGIARKDMDIQLDGKVLTITAEKKDEKAEGEEGTNHYVCERTFGTCSRTMTLPARVDAESVRATLKNGVLEIHLPRAAEPEKKKIEIKPR